MVSAAAGAAHTLFLSDLGLVFGCGLDSKGQVGTTIAGWDDRGGVAGGVGGGGGSNIDHHSKTHVLSDNSNHNNNFANNNNHNNHHSSGSNNGANQSKMSKYDRHAVLAPRPVEIVPPIISPGPSVGGLSAV